MAFITRHMSIHLFNIIMGFLLFFSTNILADHYLRGVQIDLTEDRLYSLTKGSQKVLDRLEGEVQIDFYFSRSLAAPYPSLLSYGKRVEQLLKTMEGASGGKLHLTVVDPEPFSTEEDRAVELGLEGVPLSSGEQLYLGLKVSNDIDGEKILPFLTSEREKFLEYDLMQAIVGLNEAAKPTVALLTSLPLAFGPGGPQAMMQGRGAPYVIYSQLNDAFSVNNMNADFTSLPKDMDLLMLVQPAPLTTAQQKLVEDYILAGGKAVLFLDPLAETLTGREQADSVAAFAPLLEKVGLKLLPGKILGDGLLAQKVSMGGYGPDSIKDYIFWLNAKGEALNDQDVVAGSVENLALASVGVLETIDGTTAQITPIVTSSQSAMLYDVSDASDMPDPDQLIDKLTPDGKRHMLAARVSGTVKGSQELRLFVMADTDLFDDRFWVQVQEMMGQRLAMPTAGNGSFVVSLVGQMTGNDALLDLRGRGIAQRPFTRVEAIRRAADQKYRASAKALEEKLATTEKRIALLEASKPKGTATVLSDEQQSEIDGFRKELVETRRALRDVKQNLRRDIDRLKSYLMVINILLMPILVVVTGVFVLWRRRKRSRQPVNGLQ